VNENKIASDLSTMPTPILCLLETRILGVLVEKALTVPDTYPLSLNALLSGCNQKTAREPVLNAVEADVQSAVEVLKDAQLVMELSGSRVTRYQHNMARALGLPSQSVVILAMLMLRGAQTSAELRGHTERLYRFADVSSVEAFLDELADRCADKGGPLVVRLPRAAGAREPRWCHLLSGPVDPATIFDAPAPFGDMAQVQAQLQAQQLQIDGLREQVQRLYAELGLEK
jgi:uncharacterized protein